jgi:hypothetical protein
MRKVVSGRATISRGAGGATECFGGVAMAHGDQSMATTKTTHQSARDGNPFFEKAVCMV